jgi:hypothetical protein
MESPVVTRRRRVVTRGDSREHEPASVHDLNTERSR